MSLRACSILGTVLLALAVANPASAETNSNDAPMISAKAKKAKKKKKKEEPAPEPAPAPESTVVSEEEEAPSNTNTWEKPPVEQEKPAAPPAVAPVDKPDGDGKPWSAGLLVGWAFKTDRQTAGLGSDPYGLGFGIRGGYSLDFNLYVGLFYMYYLGSSQTGEQARVVANEKTTTANYMHFGGEVGYDWWVGPVVVRPSLQLGMALGFTDVTGASRREAVFMLGPGLTVVHPWDMFFLGGDGRFVIGTGNGASAFLIAATFGLRFE